MPGLAAQSANAGNEYQTCHCGAEVPSSAYNEEVAQKQISSSFSTEETLQKVLNTEASGKDNLANFGFNDQNLNHWWEAPTGLGSRGRAVSSMFPSRTVSESTCQSDLSFEAGTAWNGRSTDACFESAPINSATPCKASTSCIGRMCDSSEASPDTVVSSTMEIPPSVRGILPDTETLTHCEAHQKERANNCSNDERNVFIRSDMLSAVLPSADEVGLQWRISELRVALRASESARVESELETEVLRKYVAEVETAAACLQARVQELEHLISFSSKDETRELDQLRAKMAMEASKEARVQTANAATAVAAAREATMELDKVKRHAYSLIKAQEEEAERLRMEAAKCRTLYHARNGQLQALKEKIEKLEQHINFPSNVADEALRVSQEEVVQLQKRLQAVKIAAQEKANQYVELLDAFEFQKGLLQSAENHLKDTEHQKKEVTSRNEWLEQQVANLQKQNVATTGVNYDHELSKVRAALEAEKQHLLAELATLRRGNQTLQVELGEWQEKFHALSQHVSGIEMSSSAHKSNTKPTERKLHSTNASLADPTEVENSSESRQGRSTKCKLYTDGSLTAMGNCEDNGSINDGRGMGSQECASQTFMESNHRSIVCASHNGRPKNRSLCLDDHCDEGKEGGLTSCAKNCSCHKTSSNFLRDNLLAAAHSEILKLKEINQCLVAACQNEFRLAKDMIQKST